MFAFNAEVLLLFQTEFGLTLFIRGASVPAKCSTFGGKKRPVFVAVEGSRVDSNTLLDTQIGWRTRTRAASTVRKTPLMLPQLGSATWKLLSVKLKTETGTRL